jgi:hypothetical protein
MTLWSKTKSSPRSVLVQLDVTGGHVPIWEELSRLPLFTLFGDGTVILARREPDGLGWEALTATLSEEEVNQILTGIVNTHRFFDVTDKYRKWPAPVDLPTTHISVAIRGKSRRISVEGLIGWRRDESEHWVDNAVKDELDRLSAIAGELTTFNAVRMAPYQARRLLVFVMIGHPDSSKEILEKSTARWPFREVPLEDIPIEPLTSIGRKVVTGQLVEKIRHATSVRNYFRSKKVIYLVSSRILLPYENAHLGGR